MRRLITLIDALYEHKVLVHVLADAPIFDLFSPDRAPIALDTNQNPSSSKSESNSVSAKKNVSLNDVGGRAASDSDSASNSVAHSQHDEVSRSLFSCYAIMSLIPSSNTRVLCLPPLAGVCV